MAAFALASTAVVTRSHAGPVAAPPQPLVNVRQTPAPAPKFKIRRWPYLVAIGPTALTIQPLSDPRVRRPPLLPRPILAATEPSAATEPPAPAGPARPASAEPSAFSPDASLIVLPGEKTAAAPAPAKPTEPGVSVLTPANQAEQELKDAVIYFATPAGPHGPRVAVPATAPLNPPTPATLPKSRATYRQEQP
jgi:hypothetical protein